jgi:hypothetical protein
MNEILMRFDVFAPIPLQWFSENEKYEIFVLFNMMKIQSCHIYVWMQSDKGERKVFG